MSLVSNHREFFGKGSDVYSMDVERVYLVRLLTYQLVNVETNEDVLENELTSNRIRCY
jgi:hypothetical protein